MDTMEKRTRLASVVALMVASVATSVLSAQTSPVQAPRVVRGVVQVPGARPLDAAHVFIIESLEGAVTREDGRFAINTSATGPLTLLVRRLGFAEPRRIISDGDTVSLVITLEASGVSLAPVSVQAGQYTASEERGATLTPLEVVTTAGTAADVNRAIQSPPGVQAGDEGTALASRTWVIP
jgi:hypothetical protein